MNAIKGKLRSRRGASITFALLLFLVCAIISGVVVVSASTVGGRMSGLRETDQRYYAATAAARQLQQIFDKKSIAVTYTKNGDTYSDVSTAPTGANGILADASNAVATNGDLTTKTWTIQGGDYEGASEDYKCIINASLSNGLLSFDIVADGPTGGKNYGYYRLTIVFASNIKKPEGNNDVTNGKAMVSWSLHSLSKGRAAQATGSN